MLPNGLHVRSLHWTQRFSIFDHQLVMTVITTVSTIFSSSDLRSLTIDTERVLRSLSPQILIQLEWLDCGSFSATLQLFLEELCLGEGANGATILLVLIALHCPTK